MPKEEEKYTPPKTLRQKLLMERTELYQTREIIHKAITELLGGAAVVSYSLQNRSVSKTRADLGGRRTNKKKMDDQIYEIEAVLSGRPLRQRSVHTYI